MQAWRARAAVAASAMISPSPSLAPAPVAAAACRMLAAEVERPEQERVQDDESAAEDDKVDRDQSVLPCVRSITAPRPRGAGGNAPRARGSGAGAALSPDTLKKYDQTENPRSTD